MALDWPTIENAIFTWVNTAAGLSSGKVIWSDQNGAAPAGDYLAIRIGDEVGAGGLDSPGWVYKSTNPAGTEMEFTTRSPITLAVSIQAFSATALGNSSARALLSKVKAALGLSTYRYALNAAGLGVASQGAVVNLAAIFGTDFEGRALLEVVFNAMQTATEKTGYIATVNTTDLTGPPSGTSGMDI